MTDVVEVVDIEAFVTGSDADRRRVASAVDRLCTDTGFLHVVGHGVDASLMTDALDVTEAFFDLPLAVKQQHSDPVLAHNRGYAAMGTEALGYSLEGEQVSAPDLFEAFNVGRDDIDGPYYDLHRRFFARNVWPDHPQYFRSVMTRYMGAVRSLSDVMLEIFAVVLGLDDRHLLDRTRHGVVTTRAINYERRSDDPPLVANQQRMGAHTDYGILTVLLADDVPGLEIRRNDTWSPVPIVDGAVVVNLGDMLARWTNDRWVSTLHRVVPPPGDTGGPVRRRSIAQFLEADPDCVIECFPSCVAAGAEPKYAPVQAGEYLLSKLLGPRELRRSSIPS